MHKLLKLKPVEFIEELNFISKVINSTSPEKAQIYQYLNEYLGQILIHS